MIDPTITRQVEAIVSHHTVAGTASTSADSWFIVLFISAIAGPLLLQVGFEPIRNITVGRSMKRTVYLHLASVGSIAYLLFMTAIAGLGPSGDTVFVVMALVWLLAWIPATCIAEVGRALASQRGWSQPAAAGITVVGYALVFCIWTLTWT